MERAGIYYTIKDLPDVKLNLKEFYFYINKECWCDKYKNYIIKVLYETPVYLIIDTIEGEKLLAILNVSDFKECFKLIETSINYEKRTYS